MLGNYGSQISARASSVDLCRMEQNVSDQSLKFELQKKRASLATVSSRYFMLNVLHIIFMYQEIQSIQYNILYTIHLHIYYYF